MLVKLIRKTEQHSIGRIVDIEIKTARALIRRGAAVMLSTQEITDTLLKDKTIYDDKMQRNNETK